MSGCPVMERKPDGGLPARHDGVATRTTPPEVAAVCDDTASILKRF